jgi:hypothetical protein
MKFFHLLGLWIQCIRRALQRGSAVIEIPHVESGNRTQFQKLVVDILKTKMMDRVQISSLKLCVT